MQKKKWLALPLGLLGAALLSLCLLLSAFLASATSGKLYYKIQVQLEIDPGVDRAVMERLDLALGDYLSGDAHALDAASEFNAREIAHMQDVFALFVLGRRGMALLALAGALLLALGVYFAPNRRRLLRFSAVGSLSCLLLLGAAAILWVTQDFGHAFSVFHHILFRNDLWLLDPETDLMIRMLPEEFFQALARVLGLRSALAASAVPLALMCLSMDFSSQNKGW